MRFTAAAGAIMAALASGAGAQERNFSVALNSIGDPVKNRKGGEALIAACPGLHTHLDGVLGITARDTEDNGTALPRPLGWSDSIRVTVRTRPNFHIPEARNRSFSWLVGGNDLTGGMTTRNAVAAKICDMVPARTDDGGYFLKQTSVNPLR